MTLFLKTVSFGLKTVDFGIFYKKIEVLLLGPLGPCIPISSDYLKTNGYKLVLPSGGPSGKYTKY